MVLNTVKKNKKNKKNLSLASFFDEDILGVYVLAN